MAIRNEQIEEKAKRQKAGVDPTPGANEGVFQTKLVGAVVEAFYFDNLGRAVQLTDNGVLKAPIVGEANTASNVGSIGDGIFKAKVGVDLQFKRLKAGPGVQLTPTADAIEIIAIPPLASGEANTGANIGLVGAGVFIEKAGVELRFRKIRAGANTTVTVTAGNEIEIGTTGGGAGGGEANTASNLGLLSDGEGIVATKVGVDLPFKRLQAGPNVSITSAPGSNFVLISAAGESNTLGATGTSLDGESVAGGKDGTALLAKRIKAGAGMAVSSNGTSVTIAALGGVGEANTASNSSSGTGVGLVFKNKTNIDFVFRRIKAGTNVTITNDADDIIINAAGGSGGSESTTAINTTASTGARVFKSLNLAELVFRRIKAGTNVSVVEGADEIVINATGSGGGEINAGLNSDASTGTGLIYKGKVGVDLIFKRLKQGANVTITDGVDDVTIASSGEINTGLNSTASTAVGIFKEKSTLNLVFKRLKAGTNVSLGDGLDEITINASGGGSALQRYQAQSTSGEEVSVFADGPGITYSRTGTVGTFTIPTGVRLISARLRLPMATIGGVQFTVVYGFGDSGAATGFANFYPPNVAGWREDTGAPVSIISSFAVAPQDRFTASGLVLNQTTNLKLVW